MGYKFYKDAISEFKDDYRFLSNFWRANYIVPVKVDDKHDVDVEFNSSEHAYQAFKATNMSDFDYVRKAFTPGDAKKRGREIKLRTNWMEIRFSVMVFVVENKFKIPHLRNLLIATYPRQLVEGNWWNDKYWGVCLKTGEGVNALGQILMKVRKDAMDENKRCRQLLRRQTLLKRKY